MIDMTMLILTHVHDNCTSARISIENSEVKFHENTREMFSHHYMYSTCI